MSTFPPGPFDCYHLRRGRELMGLTIDQLAAAWGIGSRTLRRYETEPGNIGGRELWALVGMLRARGLLQEAEELEQLAPWLVVPVPDEGQE